MDTLLKNKLCRAEGIRWTCQYCGYKLVHYDMDYPNNTYWCPKCKQWRRRKWSNSPRSFTEIECDPFDGNTLMVMNKKMEKCIRRSRRNIEAKIKTFSSGKYSQEFLRKLIPSLNPEYKKRKS